MRPERHKRAPQPLTAPELERLGLSYVGRYAATRAKLRTYLLRKLRERGWAGEGEPPVERIAERFSELGYVDDRAFAIARSEAMGRRGLGLRRVDQALKIAGIEEDDGAPARELAREGGWSSALKFAQRRRIGPFASEVPDRPGREKALAAMLRAGHPMHLARRLVAARPGEVPEEED
jgi:regulatory protein